MAYKILVCDSMAYYRMIACDALKDSEYCVIGEANNGREAVEFYAKNVLRKLYRREFRCVLISD